MLNILGGLLRSTTGEVFLEGKVVDEPGPDRAIVFQNHSLLPWLTVYGNVAIAVDKVFGSSKTKAERHDWVMHNLELVQMAQAKDKRPHEVSGGMKQRVGIARALAMQPKVLLMDEPFGALDALTRAHLQDSVMEIHARLGNTVMMITHDVDEAVLLSDRVVMMTNGPSATIGEILKVDLARPRRRPSSPPTPNTRAVAPPCWSSSMPGIACRPEPLLWLPEGAVTEFDDQQKQWLQGFVSGLEARKAADKLTNRSAASAAPSNLDALQTAAQDRTLAAGGKLVAEETAKRQRHPLDRMDEVSGRAKAGQFPKGMDVFLTKYQGLFYVAPAQDSFMCRLRIPNGILSAWQFRGLADAADAHGGGYADVTTRANLQIREIGASQAVDLLEVVQALGLTARGSGADNIRNITGSATAGIDSHELIDTRPLCSAMHHYILNHREMYGLPRKFNIAFDGGGRVPTLEDTNDIGFVACRVTDGIEPGIYFHLQLGGITGHLDFAFETGILLKPGECVTVAAAVVRAFVAHGDRTNRQKARLKYVLDRMGRDAFVAEVEKEFAATAPAPPARDRAATDGRQARPCRRASAEAGRPQLSRAGPAGRPAHLGADARVGRDLRALRQRHDPADGVAEPADLRRRRPRRRNCIAAINALGLGIEASAIRRGLVACTGNAGCKFAASNTKGHALRLADYLEARVAVDLPINIHLTGCHHSCAQHYVGDIGLLAAKVARGEESVEGYHIYIGGGAASTAEQAMAREYAKSVAFDDLPSMIERLLGAWLAHREAPTESFFEFARRHEVAELRDLAARAPELVA